jgi:pimeloyl-ACP methyl ester carboxylesterase
VTKLSDAPRPSRAAGHEQPGLPDDPKFWGIFSRHIVEANGVRINVVSGGVGEPLLLLHGNLDTWTIWSRVMPLLADRYHLIAPDIRGFGDSERVESGYDKKKRSCRVFRSLRTVTRVDGGLPASTWRRTCRRC